MRINAFRPRTVAALGAVVALSCTGLGLGTVTASASTSIPTVTVRMSDSAITMSGGGVAKSSDGGYTIHAGRIHFHVVSVKGDRQLEILRLKSGYTQQQAQKDFQSVGSNLQATQRIYNNVIFRGGAEATNPAHPGDSIIQLAAYHWIVSDFDGNALVPLTVTGKLPNQPQAPSTGIFRAYVYGWIPSATLPADGWVNFVNLSDQPHVLELMQVKESTTNAQVAKFLASGANGNPSFALKGEASTSPMSGGHNQLVHLNVPKGKYVLLCYMPDYFTLMPHFMMGMWKLVTLS